MSAGRVEDVVGVTLVRGAGRTVLVLEPAFVLLLVLEAALVPALALTPLRLEAEVDGAEAAAVEGEAAAPGPEVPTAPAGLAGASPEARLESPCSAFALPWEMATASWALAMARVSPSTPGAEPW